MSKRDILALMDAIERRALGGIQRSELDPLIHSLRWVQMYPFLAGLEAESWRDDFDPVAKWVKAANRTSARGSE